MTQSRVRLPFGILGGVSVVSAVVLLVLWFPVLVGAITDGFDHLFPVLTMKGEVVKIEGNAADIHIDGTKHRGAECKLTRIYGYSVEPDGTLYAATASRIDQPAVGLVLIAGKYDIGVWRIKPVNPQATSVQVYTEHNCIGRMVKTKIADVALK